MRLSAKRSFRAAVQAIFPAIVTVFVIGPVARADDHKEPKFILEWGKKGDKDGDFYSPIGIAINKKDEVFVTDLNNARLQTFSGDGKRLGGFDLPRDMPKRKSNQAGGIAIEKDGLLFITFMEQHKVAVYTGEGKLIREWGTKGKGDGDFKMPGGIAIAADGSIYVADQGNYRIQKFTAEGKFLAKWGEYGSNPGQFGGIEPAGSRFGGPNFLALDGKGNVYTTEGVLGRVQQFTSDGKALLVWGDKGKQPGGFGALATPYSKNTFGPTGIMIDRRDRVWVSSLNDRVQAFTPDGKFLFGIGGSGAKPGQLARPHGMAMDSKGFLYIADAGNERIQKFAVPGP